MYNNIIRTAALVAVCAAALSCGRKAPAPFPEVSEPYAITSGPHEHLLANYFGINAWSPDNRYVIVLETDVNGRLVEEGEAATIALVDLQDECRLIPVAKTVCWNFQEAAMAHWLPWAEDTFVYNDMRDGKFVAVVLNWRTGEERIIDYPVSAVSRDGLTALSINYARLRLARPDYGYAGAGQDARADVSWPEDDGLWLVDMRTGEGRLILSVASQRELMTRMEDPDGLAYFCHTIISPDAKRIFWLARTVENLRQQGGHVGKWQTTSLTCDIDGGNVRRCFPDGWAGSHFNWLDDETLAVTCKWDARKSWAHVVFKVGEEDQVRHLGPGILDWDGHCVFTPNGKFLSSDGYWNRDGYRTWVLVRLEDEAIMPLGEFWVPENYRETYSRCDLHPRFRPDGRQVAFNSVHEGSRQVYLRDINW